MARSYRELLVWQKAKTLAVQTYKATANFPRAETYGLTSQIRRAVISVASNIAEGQGRLTSGEFRHFLAKRGVLCWKRKPSSPLLWIWAFWSEVPMTRWSKDRTKCWVCSIAY